MSPQPERSGPASGGGNPWLVAIAVMLATFMEVLDTSIAAVALPCIAGSLSATNDEATQARLWSYVDDFRYLALVCFGCVPIVFALKKAVARKGAVSAAH